MTPSAIKGCYKVGDTYLILDGTKRRRFTKCLAMRTNDANGLSLCIFFDLIQVAVSVLFSRIASTKGLPGIEHATRTSSADSANFCSKSSFFSFST